MPSSNIITNLWFYFNLLNNSSSTPIMNLGFINVAFIPEDFNLNYTLFPKWENDTRPIIATIFSFLPVNIYMHMIGATHRIQTYLLVS